MDIRLPPTDEGIRLTLALRERRPGLPVLVLSQYAEPAHVTTLLEHDPRGVGYLLKDRILDAPMLADAIERVIGGGSVIDPTVVDALVRRPRLAGPLDELTGRERETLALMAEGLSDRGIAERLGVSLATVGTHGQSVFRKLALPGTASDNRRVLAVLAHLGNR